MIKPTANPLLDMRAGIGQVASTFKWELVDHLLQVVGEIHPEAGGASMDLNTTAALPRAIRNVKLREKEAREIDLFRTWVRPSMVLEDGTEWPMGVLSFSTDGYTEGSLETSLSTTLIDLRYQFNTAMPHSFGIPSGSSVRDGLIEILGIYGIFNAEVGESQVVASGGPMNWPPDATGTTIIDALASKAGFFKPYFDRRGVLVCRVPDKIEEGVGHQYPIDSINGRVERGSMVRSTNLLEAPNGYKVIGSGPTKGEVSAIAYVDPTLPFSRERTGRERLKVIRAQGVGSADMCLQIAQTAARQDAAGFATASFTSVPDPRHDTFDIVELAGEPYREIGWSMDMKPGGSHKHQLVKAVLKDG